MLPWIALTGDEKRISIFHAFGDPAPLLQLADAAARHVDCDPALEISLVADLGVLLQKLPADAGVFHPMNCGIRFLDQRSGQLRVHSPESHAFEIGGKLLLRIGRNLQALEIVVVDVGDELTNFLGAAVPEPKAGAGIAGIAAIFRFRRLLEHDDPIGAVLPRRDRGIERGASSADDDDVARFHSALRLRRVIGPGTAGPSGKDHDGTLSFCASRARLSRSAWNSASS